jgi:hypothetical protein
VRSALAAAHPIAPETVAEIQMIRKFAPPAGVAVPAASNAPPPTSSKMKNLETEGGEIQRWPGISHIRR